ncbi:aminotransferase class I/II-fold pyridoxal phosphate-dependent enzyme [Serratia ureilytica]
MVLFHGCCHNPTGIPIRRNSGHSWLSSRRQWLAAADFAYQGSPTVWKKMRRVCVFSPPNIRADRCQLLLKNFGLYNERVGACTLAGCRCRNRRSRLQPGESGHSRQLLNPPSHGAAVVATILGNDVLRAM